MFLIHPNIWFKIMCSDDFFYRFANFYANTSFQNVTGPVFGSTLIYKVLIYFPYIRSFFSGQHRPNPVLGFSRLHILQYIKDNTKYATRIYHGFSLRSTSLVRFLAIPSAYNKLCALHSRIIVFFGILRTASPQLESYSIATNKSLISFLLFTI